MIAVSETTYTFLVKPIGNEEFYNYVLGFMPEFNKIQRLVWHRIVNAYASTGFGPKEQEQLTRNVAAEFGLTVRSANSVVRNMKGRYNAIKQLKHRELRDLKIKAEAVEKSVLALKTKIKTTSDLEKRSTYKNALYWKNNKLNKMRSSIKNRESELKTGKFKICFGTKKLMQTDHESFVLQRDSELFFVGRAAELGHNQNCQLSFNDRLNRFELKVRTERGREKYVYAHFIAHKQPSRAAKLKQLIHEKGSPLTYRFKLHDKKILVQIIFKENSTSETERAAGVIGVDFNKGFVSVAEINETGNLVTKYNINYRYGAGTQTTSDLQQLVAQITLHAVSAGKPIVIEDLDFGKKKARMITAEGGREHKAMLHSLPFSQFTEYFQSSCARNQVELVKVNPAYTSQIAKKKYCDKMKLNVHQGAAFVIARRAMKIE